MTEPLMYRLVNSKGEPLGDWVTDRKPLDDYLTRRPDWCPRYHVQSNTDELDGIHVPLTDEDKKAVDDYMARLVAEIEAAPARGMALVINANGKPMFVPTEEAYQYNGNDDMGVCVFGCPRCHSTRIMDNQHCMDCELIIDNPGLEEEFEQAAEAAESNTDGIDDGSTEMSSIDFVKVLQARAAEKEA